MPASRLPRSASRVVDDAVRRAFVDGAPLRRADLLERTGLSRSALQNAVGRLLEAGELSVTAPSGPGGTGRPAQWFRLARPAHVTPVVGLEPDGGTVVVTAGTDGRTGTPRRAATWRTDLPTWTASVVEALAAVTGDEPGPPAAVVVSVPFPFAPGRGVALHSPAAPPVRQAGSRLPVADWLLTDPTPALAAALGREVVVVNDVDLAGLGEVHHGVAREARTAVYVAVRDGLGAAVVVDGRASTGAHGMTGEIAHVQAVPNGPLCSCGNRGCLATQTLSPNVVDALTLRYGHEVSFDDTEALVAHADPVAIRFLTDLGRLVGGPLATVVGFLDPDVVVVDGRLGAAAAPLTRGIEEVLHQRCPPVVASAVRIVTGSLDRPGLVGAATVGAAASAGRVGDVLRVTTTPPPPGRVEEASPGERSAISGRPEPSPPPGP